MVLLLRNFVKKLIIDYRNYLASQAKPYPVQPIITQPPQPTSISIPIKIEKTGEVKIGEEGNFCILRKEEWDCLVETIKRKF